MGLKLFRLMVSNEDFLKIGVTNECFLEGWEVASREGEVEDVN